MASALSGPAILAVLRDLKGLFKRGIGIDIDVQVDVDTDGCLCCFTGTSKSV